MKTVIKPVLSKADQKDFTFLPWRLYRDDPNWVSPLISDMKNIFNPKKNALLTLGPAQYFLAFQDGKPVGRIGVGIDHHLNEAKGYKYSYMTLFDSINDYDAAKAIFNTATEWAAQHGAEIIIGPQSPTNGDDYKGVLIKGFDSPPVLMNSYNPSYYQSFFEQYGFDTFFDRNAYFIDIANSTLPEDFTRGVEYAQKRYGYRVAPIDMKNFDHQVDAIVKVVMAGWPDNWEDMVPPTPEEVRAEVAQLKPLVNPDLIHLAWSKEGQPIGFLVVLPDFNQVLKKINGRLFPWGWLYFLMNKSKIDALRIVILFTVPEYQKKGVSASTYLEGMKAAKRLGYKWADASTIHSFNTSMNQDVVGAGGKLYKIFRVYRKNLVK
jgi:hypothetical protein